MAKPDPTPRKPRSSAPSGVPADREGGASRDLTQVPPSGGSRKRAAQPRALDTVAAILEGAALLLEEVGFQARVNA